MSEPARKRVTSDAFLAWAMEQPKGMRFELAAGEVVAMAPERLAHARMKFRLARLLALTSLRESEADVDVAEIQSALTEIRQCLEAVRGLKVQLTTIGSTSENVSKALDKLREAGSEWKIHNAETIEIRSSGTALAPVDVITLPHPGFATDLQAQMSALMCVTPGLSIITEKAFPSRFMHVPELQRMAATPCVTATFSRACGTWIRCWRSISRLPRERVCSFA